MGWYFWAPAIPFVILLFTRLRWAAILSAAAGVAAGMTVAGTFGAAWPLFSMVVLLAVVMGISEGVAGALFTRGQQIPSVLAALAAHGALAFLLWREIGHRHWALALFLVPAAMLGASAATIAAWLSRRG
jgi:hypothetical protein